MKQFLGIFFGSSSHHGTSCDPSMDGNTIEDPTPQEAREALWMPAGEQQLWETCAQLAPKHIVTLAGFWVVLHAAGHGTVKHLTKGPYLNNPQKLILTHNAIGALHAAFCIVCGVYLLYMSPGETFNQPERLFAYSYQHDFVSSITLGYWASSSLFAVLNAASVGADTLGKTLLQTLVLFIMEYLNWVIPSVLGIKIWQWWNVGGVGTIAVAFSRLALLGNIKAKQLIWVFSAGLILTLAVLWGSGMLMLWAYWWCTKDDIRFLPSTHPVHHWSKWYLPSIIVCTICWTLIAYFEFKHIVSLIKEWSDNVKATGRVRAQHPNDEVQGADGAEKKTR